MASTNQKSTRDKRLTHSYNPHFQLNYRLSEWASTQTIKRGAVALHYSSIFVL